MPRTLHIRRTWSRLSVVYLGISALGLAGPRGQSPRVGGTEFGPVGMLDLCTSPDPLQLASGDARTIPVRRSDRPKRSGTVEQGGSLRERRGYDRGVVKPTAVISDFAACLQDAQSGPVRPV